VIMMNKRLAEVYKALEGYEFLTDLVKWIRRTRPDVYTQVEHVSRSGMSRHINVYVIKDNEPINLNYMIERLGIYNRNKNGSLTVSGCGMDMGFAVTYELSRALFPDGFKYRIGEWHRNGDPSPRDRDGGYALKHRWL